MKRVVKWFIILGFLGLIATAFSYAGMRLTLGQLVGDAKHQFVERRVTFGKDSIPGVGERWAWMVTWGAVRLPGTGRARVWISPSGHLLATDPANLETRVEAWVRAREP